MGGSLNPPLGGLVSKQLLSSRWPKSALFCQVSKPPESIQSDGGLKEMKHAEKVRVYSQLYLAQLAFDAMNINDAIISKMMQY